MNPNPEDYLFQQVREMLGKENAGVSLEEIYAWLRRVRNQLNNVTTGQSVSLTTIQISVEDAQTGVQALNNRINNLIVRLDDMDERLNHHAAAIRHLNAANEPMESWLEYFQRKAGEIWKTLLFKCGR